MFIPHHDRILILERAKSRNRRSHHGCSCEVILQGEHLREQVCELDRDIQIWRLNIDGSPEGAEESGSKAMKHFLAGLAFGICAAVADPASPSG